MLPVYVRGLNLRVHYKSCFAIAGRAQVEFDYKARKRWEMEQAEERAIELHHKQVSTGVNRYEH